MTICSEPAHEYLRGRARDQSSRPCHRIFRRARGSARGEAARSCPCARTVCWRATRGHAPAAAGRCDDASPPAARWRRPRFRYAARVMSRPRRVSGRVLAVAVMTLGVAVGSLGVWWMSRSRPEPGAYIDVLALGGDAAVAVRHERGGTRSFVELIEGGAVALERAGPALRGSRRTGWRWPRAPTRSRCGSCAAACPRCSRSPRATRRSSAASIWPPSVAPHRTGYTAAAGGDARPPAGTRVELIGDDGAWAELVAIRQRTASRRGGAARRGQHRRVAPSRLSTASWSGRPARAGASRPATGAPRRGPPSRAALRRAGIAGARRQRSVGPMPATRVGRPRARATRPVARVRWPADARAPQPHNAADGALWMVLPDRLVLLDPRTLRPSPRWRRRRRPSRASQLSNRCRTFLKWFSSCAALGPRPGLRRGRHRWPVYSASSHVVS